MAGAGTGHHAYVTHIGVLTIDISSKLNPFRNYLDSSVEYIWQWAKRL